MEAMKKRACPDCVRGRDEKTVDRITGEVCGRCRGIGDIEALGDCQGPVFDDTPGGGNRQIPCPFPADLDYGGQLLCDGHALGEAINNGKPCPTCGGNPARGMHRGEVVGVGKVMRCAGSQHESELQRVSDEAMGTLHVWKEQPLQPAENVMGKENVQRYQDIFTEVDPEDDWDDDDPGAECLTDSERNPSMGGPLDDRSW